MTNKFGDCTTVVVTKPFAGKEVGDLIYVRVFDEHRAQVFSLMPGEMYFFDHEAQEYHLVDGDSVKPAEVTVSQLLTQKVVHESGGVQNEDDFFAMFAGLSDFEFDYSKYEEFQNRFRALYFSYRICTDTPVGTGVIVLDDKPVAFFIQTARRSGCTFAFYDLASKLRCKEVLDTFNMPKPSDDNDEGLITDKNAIDFWVQDTL